MGILIIFSLLLIAFSTGVQSDGSCSGTPDKVRGCYVTTWTLERLNLDQNYKKGLCTHIYVAFALFHGTQLDTSQVDAAADKILKLKEKDPNLKVLLSIGGATVKNEEWKAVANDSDTFAKNVAEYVKKKGFDGVDVDWEFPDAASKNDFTKLMQSMKSAGVGLLTAAVAANEQTIDQAYDVPALKGIVDWVNVMTYDYNGSWSATTGANAPLPDVKKSLEKWISAGMTPDKICEGLAFYGRGFAVGDPNANLGAAKTGDSKPKEKTQTAGVAAYYEICKDKASAKVDSASSTPNIVKDGELMNYDDPKSIQEKVKTANELKLRGVFNWELSQDDVEGICGDGKFPLQESVNKEMCASS